jgi:hypothetical protein
MFLAQLFYEGNMEDVTLYSFYKACCNNEVLYKALSLRGSDKIIPPSYILQIVFKGRYGNIYCKTNLRGLLDLWDHFIYG